MEVYPVPPPATDRTVSQEIFRFLLLALAFSIAYCTLSNLLFFSSVQRMRASITTSLIVGIGFALTNLCIARGARKSSSFWYEIVVTDKEIRGVSSRSLRIVRKGQIRTISEQEDGVLVSEGTQFSLFLRGLWIPKALPEYEQIRALVENWRVAS
jgi:hypothetical protein